MIKTKFVHVGITCNDPKKIEEFYTKHFGFKRARVFDTGSEKISMLKAGDVYLELFQANENSPLGLPKNTGFEFNGLRHICFEVDNLDLKLIEMGNDAVFTGSPKNLDGFVVGMKACWIADPEGNIIELCEGYKDDDKLVAKFGTT
jgi:glyoxylase I family protein